MYPAAFDERTVTAAEVKFIGVEALAPRVAVAIGEDEEQALYLDLLATVKQRRQCTRTQRRQAFEHHVEVMEALMLRQFVHGFHDRPFGGRHLELPVPWQRVGRVRIVLG